MWYQPQLKHCTGQTLGWFTFEIHFPEADFQLLLTKPEAFFFLLSIFSSNPSETQQESYIFFAYCFKRGLRRVVLNEPSSLAIPNITPILVPLARFCFANVWKMVTFFSTHAGGLILQRESFDHSAQLKKLSHIARSVQSLYLAPPLKQKNSPPP